MKSNNPFPLDPYKPVIALIALCGMIAGASAQSVQKSFSLTVDTTSNGADSSTSYSFTPAGSGYYPSLSPYGPEVTIAPTIVGADVVKSISFEYYSNYQLTGGLTISIYRNDGANDANSHAKPGTLLDQETADIVDPTPGTFVLNTVNLHYGFNAGNTVPAGMTVAVQFDNASNNSNLAGWRTGVTSPSVGSVTPYFWQYNGTDWVERDFTSVPEPSSSVLLTGAVLAGTALFLRKRTAK